MTIFREIDGWFKKKEAELEKVFHAVEPLVEKAEPIVLQIAAVAASAAADYPALAPEAALLASVSAYLKTSVADVVAVDSFLKNNAHVPADNLLHNAAVLALQHTTGETSVVVSDLDTAVQLAYSTVKASAKVATPAA